MKRKGPRIIDGIEKWRCSVCLLWLDVTDYYKDKRTPNGLKAQCKRCHGQTVIRTRDANNARRINREYMRRARAKNIDVYRERERIASIRRPDDERTKARRILNTALRAGRIIKPDGCIQCGRSRRLTAHHHDYSKLLDVVWLCYECHGNK